MAASKWKLLSDGFAGCSQLLPSPANEALFLVSKVTLITSAILEKNEADRRHQGLVERLSTRAADVAHIILRHEREFRDDPHCRNFLSSFLLTMADIETFSSKVTKKRSTLQSVVAAFSSIDDTRNEFEELWRRLDTVFQDFQSHLLSNRNAMGPHKLIRHPGMQTFWKYRMADAVEVKWVLFWDHFLDEFPVLEHLFSGDYEYSRKSSFQAKAKTRDANNVGPWEINNFFQPLEASVEQIVVQTLDLGSSISPLSPHQTESSSVSSKGEIQSWKGYWEQHGRRGYMDAELYITSSGKLLGAGSDEVGGFTWTGHSKGQRVLLTKQYIGKHVVLYDGLKRRNDKIEGVWSIEGFDSGPFCLERTAVGTKVEEPAVSRKWSGYYVQQGFRSDMTAEFVFTSNRKIYGNGCDAIGSFTWQGTFQMDPNASMQVELVKQYTQQHAVVYRGRISRRKHTDELIMEGVWALDKDNGTFELRSSVL